MMSDVTQLLHQLAIVQRQHASLAAQTDWHKDRLSNEKVLDMQRCQCIKPQTLAKRIISLLFVTLSLQLCAAGCLLFSCVAECWISS